MGSTGARESEKVRSAKNRLSALLERRRWDASAGIERDGKDLRIVLSVPAGKGAEAEELLSGAKLGVPVRVREVGAVRVRSPGQLG